MNGVDRHHTPRTIALIVDVSEPPADVELTATPNELSPQVGDTITIALAVRNKGAGTAVNVVIPRAFLETGFTVVKAVPADGSYSAATHEWTIPRIAPGAIARLLLTAVVLPPAPSAPHTR